MSPERVRARAAAALVGCLLVLPAGAPAQERPLLIPAPVKMTVGKGRFLLTPGAGIFVQKGSPEVKAVGEYLAERLRPATGYALKVSEAGAADPPAGGILLTAAGGEKSLGEEGYELAVTGRSVVLRAPGACGMFRGVQTIRQLFPPAMESGKKAPGEVKWAIPCVRIVDKPRFSRRGILLDPARRFLTKEFLKRYVDLLAYHKMNVLHLHLTDDQGWRLEIRKYPRLTEVGAWRGKGEGRHGGFYTQADIREIVAYAAGRYVTVLPEIEMPGHACAALAAYPELSCTGGPFAVSTRWGVHRDVFCAGNDKTLEFLTDVLSEVIELFPSPAIHIGGDEVPKARWSRCPKCQARIKARKLKNADELQSWFIKQIARFLRSKGRRLIGWDEIMRGGLAEGAVVQSWHGHRPAAAAARAAHDAILSPTSHCYFDYGIGRISLRKVYAFNPLPVGLTDRQTGHVLGGMGNMWGERAPQDKVDEKLFPRTLALAEVLWTAPADRDFDEFKARAEAHRGRLERMGVVCGAAGK